MTVNHRLSEHLRWEEVRCKCGGRGSAGSCDGGVLRWEVVELFERIRRRCAEKIGADCSLKVLSGVRCPHHNRKVGGAENSTHLAGKALDLRCPTALSLPEFWCLCEEEVGMGGLGTYAWGAHVDIEPSQPPRRWTQV
jgi:uncharacterized protein YcbK (DUF882 family)